jgi:hypothetical protein
VTATFVRDLEVLRPDVKQRLWRVDPPMAGSTGGSGPHSHVVTSSAVVMFSGPETYIFAATAEGEIVDWGELDGSMRGVLDHNAAIRNAGYVPVGAP